MRQESHVRTFKHEYLMDLQFVTKGKLHVRVKSTGSEGDRRPGETVH